MSADRKMRTYRVEDVLTVVGVGYVEATSKAEAKAIAANGGVEFVYTDSAEWRRGDGLHVTLAPRGEA